MTKRRGLIKDVDSGHIRATQHFRDKYGATFGRAGIDLSKSFENEKALLLATIDTLDDATCDALARELGLMNQDEKGDD